MIRDEGGFLIWSQFLMSIRSSFHQFISLPVVVAGHNRYIITQKFLEGITYFADQWPGNVTVFMEPVVTAHGQLDYIEVSGQELPFTIKPICFDDPKLRQEILHSDLVHWGPHYKLHDLGSLLQKAGHCKCLLYRIQPQNPASDHHGRRYQPAEKVSAVDLGNQSRTADTQKYQTSSRCGVQRDTDL